MEGSGYVIAMRIVENASFYTFEFKVPNKYVIILLYL